MADILFERTVKVGVNNHLSRKGHALSFFFRLLEWTRSQSNLQLACA